MPIYSPLRYPGGKNKLSTFFIELIQDNNLSNRVYIEPFAGGSAVALALLSSNTVSKVILNDLDRSIYAFWYSVLYKTDELIDLIQSTPVDLKTWGQCKQIQSAKTNTNLLELGFSTFFLNRTNFSGIIQTGPVGGKLQKGKWKIDAKFNKNKLINRIKHIQKYKRQIRLYNMEANKLIDLKESQKTKAFYYFDPPYYAMGKRLYAKYCTHEDHTEIANKIQSIKHSSWVVSYDNHINVKNLYSDCHTIEYELDYKLKHSGINKELMFFSNDLDISSRTLEISINTPKTLSLF